MLKTLLKRIFVSVITIGVVVFGQNCHGEFKALDDSVIVSSAGRVDDDSRLPIPTPPDQSDAEKLGLSGRIPSAEFAFPLDDSSPLSFPSKLSETKLFKDLNTLEAANGLLPFEVNMPLWSDAAIKKRWLALPEGSERIQFSESDNWSFPVGTILVKHFELRLTSTFVRKLETRIFLHQASGWKGYSYKWNDTQTDADLLEGTSVVAETYTVDDILATGGQRQQTWNYPSQAQCIQCHAASGFVLGPRTAQLNRSLAYDGESQYNQLDIMKQLNLVSEDMPSPSSLEAFPQPNDNFIPIAERARAYLSVNCATCHQGANPPAGVRLHHTLDISSMNILDVTANNNLGLGTGAVRLKRGDKANSTLFGRMNRTDATRMPKVGSIIVDPVGISLIGQWIDSL